MIAVFRVSTPMQGDGGVGGEYGVGGTLETPLQITDVRLPSSPSVIFVPVKISAGKTGLKHDVEHEKRP